MHRPGLVIRSFDDKITFPLETENIGDAVANLQDVLQLMLDREIFWISAEELSRVRSGRLRERGESYYGT